MAKMKNYRLYRPEKVQNSGPKQGPLRTLVGALGVPNWSQCWLCLDKQERVKEEGLKSYIWV